ncbi:MAG: ABC transporter permease, partial [Chloroflexi bacterium]|nr:ABC transporter permease [Chloroflexota bacterium]
MRQTGENSNWWALLSVGSLIAWRRIRLDWRLQMAVAFGMLLATALMASGVIYSSVLRQAALRHILKTSRPADVNFAVQVFSPLDRAIYEANERLVEDKIYPTLRPYLRDRALFIQTPTFFFTGREVWDASDDTRPRGPLQYFSSAESQVGLVEGRFPSASTGTLEVVMESNAAAGLGLKVGDSLEMYPGILGEMAPTVKAQIVGLVEAIDPKDEYWFDSSGKLASTSSGWPWAPMFTTQRVVLETLPLVYSNLSITFDWYFYLDKDGVKAERVDDLVAAVETISSQLKGSIKDSTFATNLPAVLARYDHRLLLSRMPLYLTIFLVVGTLLYYLFLVASLLARERTPEIALLKSRGATARQIGFLALTEGGLMAGPAILLGPVLALAMTLLTDRIAPTRLGQTGLLSASLSWQAYLIGAAGALLAVIVFAAAILTAARHTMAEVRQSQARPPATLFLHRYYLDLLILAVVGLLWWQTQSQGSFLVRRLGDEGLQLDFSLLLGPVLGLVSIGLLVLRLFPLLLLLLERVVGPLGPIWLAQALKRSARDPIPGGLMVMLLLLATGLGVVGAAFSASLQQSQTDQVYYETGSDVRVVHTGGAHVLAGHGPAASISSLSGVGGATDVLRTSAWVRTTGFGSEATVLAIDPEGFTDAAWYRLDFNKAALQGLDNSSSPQDTPEGIAIPSSAQGLSLWATVSRPSPLLQLYARLRDSQGYFFDVLFSSLDNPGWSRFSLALPQDP